MSSPALLLPPATPPAVNRDQVLAALFGNAHLMTPPPVAMKVVNAAANPDCRVSDIANLISQDAGLAAKLLKTVNSSIYGLPKPVASMERAVLVLGLNPLRSLVLGLSLPIMQSTSSVTESSRKYWVSSVGGAILAREFATLVRRPAPDNDMTAGLLRNLGAILIERTFPEQWKAIQAAPIRRQLAAACEVEREILGIDHAEVSAELLKRWNLPPEIYESIRYHHEPGKLAGQPKAMFDRAELLYFVELLVRLEEVAEHPDMMAKLMSAAGTRFGLTAGVFGKFLAAVLPKIGEFAALLQLNIGQLPDYATIMSVGCEEMVKLAMENARVTADDAGMHTQTHHDAVTPAPVPGWTTRPTSPQPQPGSAWRTPAPSPSAPSGASRLTKRTAVPAPTHAVTPPPLASMPDFRQSFASTFPLDGCRLDDFELKRILGRGAMGVVFLGWEPGLRRNVAVKMLAPELAAVPVARERFAREARTAAAIRHENVVGIYAVREAAGVPYLAMEFVDGGNLEDLIEKERHLSIAEVVRIARQMAAGLSAAHAQGIVHRDIKPANIMLANPDGKVKISDFGLARGAEDPSLTTAGALIGSPLYMSPEQVRGQVLDARSDLFSLAGVLYAALVGRPPFAGRHVAAVLNNVCEVEPPPPHTIRSEVPRALSEVVMQLLRKEPEERFQSAAEFATALPG